MGPILPDKSNSLYHSLYKTGTENNGSETNYMWHHRLIVKEI